MTPRPVSLLIGAGLVGLALFGVFVWPTPYECQTYHDIQNWEECTNRFTGRKYVRPPGATQWWSTDSG